MLSEKNLDILIKNLSLSEFASVSQELADRDEKLLKVDEAIKYIDKILTTDMKVDLDAVLITIKSILE